MQKPFKTIFMFITDLKVYDISKKALINRDLESSKRLAKLEETCKARRDERINRMSPFESLTFLFELFKSVNCHQTVTYCNILERDELPPATT